MENRIDFANLQAMKRTKMNFQCVCDQRVQVQDGAVTVVMEPDDGDGNKGVADRRRNELSIKGLNNCFCLNKGEAGTWGLDVLYHEAFSDPVDGKNFYHIVQIKYNTNLSGPFKGNTKPIFTVGFKRGQLVVYQNLSSGHVPIGPIGELVNKWMHVEITVHNEPRGLVQWRVGDQCGEYACDDLGDTTELYLKLGQYRSKDLQIDHPTATSYANVWMRKL